ncbi:M20 family peptidase [Flexithrix dorotheae]|uniref:M20 family peptidase n=1 Tax=Flexithrix dorotheae TaxID=70993 RepID=UPI0003704843|nr:M20 family peptidase [Flexithrix dorotheae]
MVKKILTLFLLGFILLLGVLLFNTLTYKNNQPDFEPVSHFEVGEKSIQNFSRAIQFPTISFEDPNDFDSIPFLAFHQFLSEAYPLADSLLEKKVINKYSLLYKWEGQNKALKPAILMGHMDVVPIEKPQNQIEFERRVGKLKKEMYSTWEHPPFGGDIADGHIWGRGAIDDKISIIGNLEAVEKLLTEGYSPERTIYFAFGHDEEIGGKEGAIKIVEYLKENNIQPEFVMDEGGIITGEKVPGIDVPVALIGTAEKGFLSVELSINLPGGHSSMPQSETAIEVLSRAIVKLRDNQFEKKLTPPVRELLGNIGPEMPFLQRIVFANLWLFEGVVLSIYEKSPAGNASVRTTTAPTIINSGFKDNVLPSEAKATINFRVLPGETSEDVIAHIREILQDNRVQLKIGGFKSEPTPVSPTEAFGYHIIAQTVKQQFPEAIVTPYLVVGGTDSRYYRELTDQIYRFMPVTDPIGFHDINERISIEDFSKSLNFYYLLLKNVGK